MTRLKPSSQALRAVDSTPMLVEMPQRIMPALVCQASGARHHLVSPMRAAGERQNAFLQIDYHQRRVFCIEF